jgi:hypothetical protein
MSVLIVVSPSGKVVSAQAQHGAADIASCVTGVVYGLSIGRGISTAVVTATVRFTSEDASGGL